MSNFICTIWQYNVAIIVVAGRAPNPRKRQRTEKAGKDADNALVIMSDIEDDGASPRRTGRGGRASPRTRGRGGSASPYDRGRGDTASPRDRGRGDTASPYDRGRGGSASPLTTGNGGHRTSGDDLFNYGTFLMTEMKWIERMTPPHVGEKKIP